MFPEIVPSIPEVIYWSALLLFLGALVAYVVTAIVKPIAKMMEKAEPTKRRPWRGFVPPVVFDAAIPIFCSFVGAFAGGNLWPQIGSAGWIIGASGATASTILVAMGYDVLGRFINGAVDKVARMKEE